MRIRAIMDMPAIDVWKTIILNQKIAYERELDTTLEKMMRD